MQSDVALISLRGLGRPGKRSQSSSVDLPVNPLSDDVAIPWSAKFIPTFQGDTGEEWETWISRLEAVSDCHGWNENQKVGVILSALRDTAAKFVYKAINRYDRKNYAVLVSELGQSIWVVGNRTDIQGLMGKY